MRLQSTELQLPHVAAATEFLTTIWRLVSLGKFGGTTYFRGAGSHPYLLSLTEANSPAIKSVSFSASEAEIDALQARARDAHVAVERVAAFDVPGAGSGVQLRGPENQTYRFCTVNDIPDIAHDHDTPIQITHTVINVNDLKASETFATEVLGFRISDRTKLMTFVRCNQKHHCVAYAPAPTPSLNHIAFEMQDIDAVMRGVGRMRDAGFACAWGPGRHGPGDNVFGYFIAPFGAVIEYTAEISEVAEDYRTGTPDDWKWPPGRIDQWGLSTKDVASIATAEKRFQFMP